MSSPNGTFLLVNVTARDSGRYEVNVTNDLGCQVEVFVLSVRGQSDASERFIVLFELLLLVCFLFLCREKHHVSSQPPRHPHPRRLCCHRASSVRSGPGLPEEVQEERLLSAAPVRSTFSLKAGSFMWLSPLPRFKTGPTSGYDPLNVASASKHVQYAARLEHEASTSPGFYIKDKHPNIDSNILNMTLLNLNLWLVPTCGHRLVTGGYRGVNTTS